MVLVVGLGVNALAAVGDWWLMQRRAKIRTDIQAQQQDSDRSTIGIITQQIRQLNGTVTALGSVLPTSRAWPTDLVAWLNTLPATITLTDLTLTLAGDLQIQGVAATRADYLELDAQLKDHPALSNIQTNSSANKPTDLPFQYTARLRPPA